MPEREAEISIASNQGSIADAKEFSTTEGVGQGRPCGSPPCRGCRPPCAPVPPPPCAPPPCRPPGGGKEGM